MSIKGGLNVKIIVTKNYEEMSREAGKVFAAAIKANPSLTLGLATGSTPEGMYAELVKAYKAGELSFENVKSINLDEYYPIKKSDEQSYDYFMNYHLFSHVNIKKENVHLPNGEAADAAVEAAEYEKLIDSMGGADLQVLGIGRNGHIGFNEPDTFLCADTHLTGLTASTIEANSRFFENEDAVPKHALTMGIGSIFKSKKIVLIASGAEKAEAVKRMLEGKITTECPATFLALHPDCTLICDEAAYSLVK